MAPDDDTDVEARETAGGSPVRDSPDRMVWIADEAGMYEQTADRGGHAEPVPATVLLTDLLTDGP